MKYAALLLIGLLLTSCAEETSRPGVGDTPPWVLLDDKMNFGVFVVDYETYAFERGNVSHYNLCEDCDRDSFPFHIENSGNSMIRCLAFVYTETGDTLFYASIIYMGIGDIYYPSSFLDADQFEAEGDSVPLPEHLQIIGNCDLLTGEDCMPRISRAWDTISRLDVVKAFAEGPYRVGFFLYPRWSSMFSPSYTDWVIFLYRGKVTK